MVKDEKIIQELDRLQKSVKRKHAAFVDALAKDEERHEKIFKPITNPLNEIKAMAMKSAKAPLPKKETIDEEEEEVEEEEEMSDDEEEDEEEGERTPMPSSEDELEGAAPISNQVRFYLDQVHDPRHKKEIDKVFGVKHHQHNNMWTMGDNNIPVSFINDRIHVADRSFELTKGLLELLIFKNPSLKPADESYASDMRSYREILKMTGAHMSMAGQVKSSKSNKYKEYIKPLFKRNKKTSRPPYEEDTAYSFSTPHRHPPSLFAFSTPQSHRSQEPSTSGFMTPQGRGLMRFDGKRKREYVHWDDPNELVERLRDLYDEYDAGNGGVYNEIISILEELTEAGFIE